jgi:hypothetical protein
MEAILDREMPAGRRRDWRRWVLLVLLLLLLIGVCNCPGRGWFSADTTKSRVVVPSRVLVPSLGLVPSRGGPSAPAPGHATPPAGVSGSSGGVSTPVGEGATPATGSSQNANSTLKSATPDSEPVLPDSKPLAGRTVTVKHRQLKPDRRGSQPDTSEPDASQPDASEPGTSQPGDSIRSKSQRPGVPVPAVSPKKSNADSKNKKPPPPPKDQPEKERQDGWMVGIGLNQFFTVGSQQASSFNSGGITGTLGDYIPVPMVRYYFNPKLYVQLEAQINTPQYTKKNLVAVSTPVDSLGTTTGGALITVQKTVSINKLFYFNVPLSVHYTVFDHLDLGAGLQYSRLTNGVGVFNNNYNTGGTDSLSTETKSFKGDSVYKEIKTHEFRFLVDANYNWQHFIFGIRYNQALSKFIHVEISPGQITQARNSSLQLYLRYILWDGRKKKPLLPAK